MVNIKIHNKYKIILLKQFLRRTFYDSRIWVKEYAFVLAKIVHSGCDKKNSYHKTQKMVQCITLIVTYSL